MLLKVPARPSSKTATTGTEASWDTQDGQAELRLMGCEPAVFTGRLCDRPGCDASTNPSVSACPPAPSKPAEGRAVRSIGLEVHRDFCVIAISENGHVRSAGKVKTSPEQPEILADSLRP